MKVLRIICWIFLTALLSFFLILWFFFINDRGVYFMLNNIISRVPNLKVNSITGNWWHGVMIQGLHYQNHGILVQSTELYIALDFRNLWSKSFCVHSLFFKDFFMCMEVEKFDRSLLLIRDSKKVIIRMIKKYPIIFRNIILNNVSIKLGTMVISLDKCNTGLMYNRRSLTVSSTFFSGLKVLNFFDFSKIKVPEFQAVSLRDIFCDQSFLSSILKDLFSKFICEKQNTAKIMSYNLILERMEVEDLVFVDRENVLIKKICVQGIISREYIRLVLLDIISSSGEARISGHVRFSGEYPINFMVNFRANSFLLGEEVFNCVISGVLKGPLCIYCDFFGDVNGYLILKVVLNKFNVPMNLVLNIESLDGSFINNSDYLIQKFRFNLYGNYNDYKLNVQSTISSPKSLFSADIIMNANGNINNLVISNLNIKDSHSVLDVIGVINNKNDFTDWSIKLILKKININSCSLIWPIDLSGEINIEFLFNHECFCLRLFDIILHGIIRGCHPVYFRSLLYGNFFNILDVSHFFLSIGSNTLKITNESLRDFSGITAVIKFPCLNDIFPILNGSIFGDINVFLKSFRYYKYLVNITAKSLCSIGGDWKIDNIFLKGDFHYYKILKGQFKCELNDLTYHSLFLSKLVFQILGDAKNHNLKLSMCTDLFNIMIGMQGSFDIINKDWNGNIIRIDLIKQGINCTWNKRLMMFYRNLPNEFVFLANNLDKCIFRVRCHGALGQQEMKKFVQYFQSIHLTIQQSFFLRSSLVNGVFVSFIDLTWDKESFVPYGKIFLLGQGIEWIHMLLGKKLFIIFEDFVLNIFLKREYISCNWLSKFSDCSQCNGNLKISLFDQYRCSGGLCIKNISLFFLNIFLDTNNVVEGVLDSDVKIGGNVFSPEIYGDMKLTNLILQGDQIPFLMTSSQLLLSFTKDRSLLYGVIGTSHGTLHLSGDIHWNNIQSIYSRVCITGHNIRFKLFQEVNMDISPVIILEITPSLFVLKGTLDIPWGSIKLKEYLKNIDVSSDTVIIDGSIYDKSFRYKDCKSDFVIIMNIIVHFGSDVEIHAFGLDAKLHGNLEVFYDENGLGLKGYINLSKGSFNFCGQSFFIKKGQLLFSGLIGAQPYLNIEAVQGSELTQSDFSIAGIRITGSISSPEIEIFSDVTVSQEEAMSYLLSGQGLDIVNMNSNNTIRSVLVKLGIFQIEKLVKQFGGVLGIKDLLISTDGFGNNSQIILSGNIIPGLQVKYGIGMFNSLATATIRYSLLSNLYLESVFGITQSIDLVYQFKY